MIILPEFQSCTYCVIYCIPYCNLETTKNSLVSSGDRESYPWRGASCLTLRIAARVRKVALSDEERKERRRERLFVCFVCLFVVCEYDKSRLDDGPVHSDHRVVNVTDMNASRSDDSTRLAG